VSLSLNWSRSYVTAADRIKSILKGETFSLQARADSVNSAVELFTNECTVSYILTAMQRENDHIEDLDIDGKIILNSILTMLPASSLQVSHHIAQSKLEATISSEFFH
jgi:hypothetical protein